MTSALPLTEHVVTRWLGLKPYEATWQAMQDFTNSRDATTPDEIWFLEHGSIFTLGQNSKPEHVLRPSNIQVISTDRGGQVTYHGPGQLMVYVLLDLKRKKFTVRDLVCYLERSIIDLLANYHIKAIARREAPGVYLEDGKKICSVGLRIRRGCSYHGLAFNIAMDLGPFGYINPCGYSELKMTQLADLATLNFTGTKTSLLQQIAAQLSNFLMRNLGYTSASYINSWNRIDGT
jgi:lipoyl(octanoyl) transferase